MDASGKVLARMKSADEVEKEKKEKKEKGGGKENRTETSRRRRRVVVGIIVADLDGAAIEGVRERMPVAEHREAGRKVLGLKTNKQKK